MTSNSGIFIMTKDGWKRLGGEWKWEDKNTVPFDVDKVYATKKGGKVEPKERN